MFHADGGIIAILDADPAREAGACEAGEDRVVVVQAAPDDAVFEDARVALVRAECLQIGERAALEIAVARVHRDDAVEHVVEQRQRVVAGDDGVRRIVVHAEPRAARDGGEELEENVALLGKLGEVPVAVLVMVFEDQSDPAALGVREQFHDAIRRHFHPVID